MIFDASTLSGLCGGIEAIVNNALKYDPATQKNIARITEVLAIDCQLPANNTLTFYISGQEEGLALFSYCEEEISTRINGSPIALLALIKQPTSLANSGVTVSGSIGLLQTWQTLLQNLDIDWEDAISQVLGDIAGPFTTRGMRDSAQWAKQQFNEQKRLFSEFITEEVAIVPSKAETEHLADKVDEMKLDIDRLTAKMKLLDQQLHQQQDQQPKQQSSEQDKHKK